MARQIGVLKISGSFNGLSFFETKYGFIVRRKGGFNAKRLKKDAAYVRSRETANEFKLCSEAGKLLRQTLAPLNRKVCDSSVTWRTTQLMCKLKELDNLSKRGGRNPGEGLKTTAGQQLVRKFNFNNETSLSSMTGQVSLDNVTGAMTLKKFVPAQMKSPKGATHFMIKGGLLIFDALNGKAKLIETNTHRGKINKLPITIALVPVTNSTMTGIRILVMTIEFMQKINGTEYELLNGKWNASSVVGVL
jgi:hypothetical protein